MKTGPTANLVQFEVDEVSFTPRSVRRRRPLVRQGVVALVVYGAAFCCGLTGGYSGVLLPQLRANTSDLLVDDNMASWIGENNMGTYTGTTSLGCLLSGLAMNVIGRSTVVKIGIFSMFSGWILIAFANAHHLMLAGRAVDGFGRGFSFHLEEMADLRWRGPLSACIMLVYSIGIMLISMLGIALNWRISASISAGLSLLNFVGYCFVPESPVWLVRKGKIQKAREVFKWLWNHRHEEMAEEDLQEVLKRYKEEAEENHGTLKPRDILKSQYLKPFLIMHIANLMQVICGTNLFIFYASDIISGLNQSGDINVNFMVVFTAAVRVAFLATSCVLLMWLPRRFMCILSGTGSGLAALVIATASALNYSDAWFVCSSLTIYVAFNTFGFFVLVSIMVGEILPSRIRSFGGAYIFTMNDIALFAATKAFPFIVGSIGVNGLFWIFGCSSLVCSLFLLLLLPETKGCTLIDVERYFLQKNVLWQKRRLVEEDTQSS
ncbi:hypothetical protein C0J52_00752 [Blattella germanica]|nr:hypothetical protein C0J52_00752 [Blattella germanica]